MTDSLITKSTSGRGGPRPGSGRKKGSKAPSTMLAEAFKLALVKAVRREKQPIIRALIKRAKEGDVPALREILDRVLGKVSQPIDFGKETLQAIQDAVAKIANE